MSKTHSIFGMGPVGRHLAVELLKQGERVRIITRKGSTLEGAEAIMADATDLGQARKAISGSDVVYNCTNVDYTRWPQLLPPLYNTILEAASLESNKYVYTDNLYMYGPMSGPMSELLPSRPVGPKSSIRARLAEDVLCAHQDGRISTAIVRGSDFYGPNVDSALLGSEAIRAMLRGKSFPALGNLDAKHSFTYVPDLSKALAIAGREDRANGQIWHAPSLPAISTRAVIELFGKELGVKPKIMNARRPIVTVLGVVMPLMRSLKETLYQWENDFVMDSSKFESTFGLTATSWDVGIKASCDGVRHG